MAVISFVTQKGGSGKSTLAINCAVAAMQAGKRVLLLDMDPQGTAYYWGEKREAEKPDVVKIDVAHLGDALDLAKVKRYDWVLIDTPGHESPGTVKAIGASDFCVVPCRPTHADVQALPPTIESVKRSGKAAAVVLSQTSPMRSFRITGAEEALGKLIAVSSVNIATRTAYQDAHAQGMGVTEYEPEGKAAEEIRELWQWIATKVRKAVNG
jgi:chromosome partitioning protein